MSIDRDEMCCHCPGAYIYWDGERWRHVSNHLASCDNGASMAQPRDRGTGEPR